jgi:hypothetical protein
LNRGPYEPYVLYLMGNVALQKGFNGQAITLLEAVLRSHENMPEAWNDLGCALKAEHYDDAASKAWEQALVHGGRTAGVLNNLATLWADSGYPEKARPFIDEALALDPENPHVHWNNALALLTEGDWAKGWPEHEHRKRILQKNVSPRQYAPDWQRESWGRLIVHGEQGLGDEIMFATCLPDLLREHPNIAIECERKLVPLFARSFHVPVFATEDEAKASGLTFDYQFALGSLPSLYRMSDEAFPAASPSPLLLPDPSLVEHVRTMLKDLPRPLIGVSWMGGSKTTRVHHRSLSAKAMKDLVHVGTAISLQYGEYSDIEGDAAGLLRFGDWTDGTNLDKLAAMIMVMDDILSVTTTLIHLAGALGKPVQVLTPLRSSWRYGQRSGTGAMRWYPQHTLWRQEKEHDWSTVLRDVGQWMKARYPG